MPASTTGSPLPTLPVLPSDTASEQADRPAPARALSAALREPLVHFLVLGALLFAIDAQLSPGRNPTHIVIDASVDETARATFRAARQREPNAEELAALRQRWLENEVLYREGLAMQLDKGDAAIRDRVIFKSLSVIDARLSRPAYDNQTLRAWFEDNRGRYDEPARFDFLEAVLAGERSEADIRALVERLNGDPRGETGASLRRFKARPASNIEQSYGAPFAEALAAATPGRWLAVAGTGGWRAVRLEALTPPRPADFETLKNVVLADWTDATMARLRSEEVARLAHKYTLSVEADAP